MGLHRYGQESPGLDASGAEIGSPLDRDVAIGENDLSILQQGCTYVADEPG